MNSKRLVVWTVIFAFVFARTPAFAQSHEQGVAAGNAANSVIRGMVNTTSATSVVPGYTATPAETAYAGRASLGADANARLAACALTPTDSTCQALRNAVTSANKPRPTIGPGDPAVAAASRIARNPSTDLGSLAAYYSGCVTSDVASPPRAETRNCSRYVGAGSYSCSNLLTVAIDRTTSCSPGDWFAHAGSGSTGLDAQCLPDRPNSRQHFRVTSGATPLTYFDVDMTTALVFPQRVAVLGSTFSWMTGVEIRTGVWVANKSCAGSTCSLTAMIADDVRENCTGNADSGFTCTSAEPFLKVYAPCRAGTQGGEFIQDTVCTVDGGCTSTTLDGAKCYAPSAGWTPYAGIDVTGAVPGSFWNIDRNRAAVGWAPNPAYGAIPTMALTYTKPVTSAATTDTWNSQCPALASAGRCSVASAPRCVEGPSTKVIDGIPVTRDCWETRSTMSCSSTVSADQCAPLLAAGCTPLASSCAQTNTTSGACEIFRDQYSCPVAAETVTTATNCPSNVFCLGTSCFNIGATNDADFARSMSMLEAARESGVYLDSDRMQVFKGEANRCRDRFLTNCCYTDGAGAGMTNQSVFGSGTRLVYDILMNSENREFVVQGMSALLTSAGFSGTFSSYGFTIAVNGTALPAGSTVVYSSSAAAGEGVVVAFDPWSLVIAVIIYIVLSMLECNEGEARLALKEGARLCHSVGTYCSSCLRVLGVCVSCVERTTSKCCFNSMIARIVNEQGRTQVAKAWGDSGNPDCSGFSVGQLQTLDFAAMDLSEFYASLVPATPDLAAIQGINASRIRNCYWGQGKC